MALDGKPYEHDGVSYPSGLLSSLFFWPLGWLVPESYQRRLASTDMYKLSHSDLSETAWDKFYPYWQEEMKRKAPSLTRALLRTFSLELLFLVFLWFCWSALQFVNPIVIPFLSKYFYDKTVAAWKGYVYMAAIGVATFLVVITFNVVYMRSWRLGIRVRSILVGLIYRKVLRTTSSAIGNRGRVLNMVSTDAQIILDTLPTFIQGLISPIQFVVTVGLLGREVGWFCLIPVVFAVLMMPFLMFMSKTFPAVRFAIQKAADVRIKLTTEFLSTVRIVKYYAWERPLLKKIDEAREAEIVQLTYLSILNSVMMAVITSLPTLALGFTLVSYISKQTALNNGSLFAAVSYIAFLRMPYVFFPLAYNFGILYRVSLGRIRDFALDTPDLQDSVNRARQTATPPRSKRKRHATSTINPNNDTPVDAAAVSISQGQFAWSQAGDAFSLNEIDIQIQPGQLVCLIGGVGSGKSSLVSAILGEMPCLSGQVNVRGSVATVSQEPFLMNMSIRDNILFGHQYDAVRYQSVVNACALVNDFEMLPSGDFSLAGERGSSLSGGQCQRIGIARALYSDRDIYLFDDPFSSVDSRVGNHIFNEVCLHLKSLGKAVLLVTNQMQLLHQSDRVHVMSNGRVVEHGTYAALADDCDSVLHALLLGGDAPSAATRTEKQHVATRASKGDECDGNLKTSHLTEKALLKQDKRRKDVLLKQRAEARTRQPEKAVSAATYALYFSAGSILIFLFVGIFNLLRTACNVGYNLWLARWTNPAHASDFNRQTRIGVFVCLVLGEVLFICGFTALMVFFIRNASRNIHRRLLSRFAHASVSFFDKTPLGGILSRFTKDVAFIDTLLPMQLQQSVNILFMIVGVVVNLAIASKYAVILALLAVAYYVTIILVARRPTMQIQRSEAGSRGPIFSHLGETLNDLVTVRAYNMCPKFTVAMMNKVDVNATDYLTLRRFNQWLNMTVGQGVNVIVMGLITLFVLLRNYAPAAFDASLAVSACANSVILALLLGNMAFLFADFEARMNAPERVLECDTLVDQEAAYEEDTTKPHGEWPSKGAISFDNVVASYKAGAPPTLNGLSFKIKAGEKIGIVGRTGAGKSTLANVLFRMLELESGSIMIDGVDISTLGLYDLRSGLSMIPQSSQIFSGTVRYNLDPFDEFSDDEVWRALDTVCLKSHVLGLTGALSCVVEENGDNFSAGQKQLLCMARCLLKDTRILILDEATSSLDVESDAIVQRTLRTRFRFRTILTIAHRLGNVIDSDRVMVLEAGRVVEFDTPKRLLKRKSGVFYDMVHATGVSTASQLTAIAMGIPS